VIAEAVAAVRDRMARAAARAGRKPDEITLVAVTKTHPPELVAQAFAAGVRDCGENRVQEAAAKIEELQALRTQGLRWHLVGHLQSNKARRAVALFDCIQSVDSSELAARLDSVAAGAGRTLPVLVQLELGGETTKSGLREEALLAALESMRGLSHLRVIGLMTIPPPSPDPEATRPFFARLRGCLERAHAAGLLAARELSMGMSGDFEVAIEEGATIVRVGTAIFGERD
jgi:pyridoxal phosphate enzyme (YggS family)